MDFLSQFLKLLSMITVFDVIDILIVTFVVYRLILLIRETRAQTVVKGILFVLVIVLISGWFNLHTLNYFLEYAMQNVLLVIIVIFQPEIRRMLEQIGRSKITKSWLLNFDAAAREEEVRNMAQEVSKAASILSSTKTGALIVIERETKIGDIVSTGTSINADVSSELIRNIFFPNSPLHDGALIIRDGKISAAGCFLPLTQQDGVGRELGTRHRAAMGMSECSDALIIVASEETGRISVATDGNLMRNLTQKSLENILNKELFANEEKGSERKFGFWKARGKK